MITRVAGIDPGITGAIAIWGSDASLCIWDMPTWGMTVGKKVRQRVDAVELLSLMEIAKDMGVKLVVIEAVGGRPKQGASAGFVFGYTVGLIYMACIAVQLAIETVPPQTWKKIFHVPKDDEGIKHRYDEMFPEHRNHARGPRGGFSHDRGEAAMLAKFGLERVLGSVKPDSEWRAIYKRAQTGA